MTAREIEEAVRLYRERRAARMARTERGQAIIRYRARRAARIAVRELRSLGISDDDLLDILFSCVKIKSPSKLDGGPGSGNFNHKGVPGQVGGSAPSGPAKELSEAISTGRVSTKLNRKKQSKHTKGSPAYNKATKQGKFVSTMSVSNNEAQRLVNKYSGKGHIRISGDGQIRETFEHTSAIGVYVSKTGESMATNRGTIHYSKDGAHIVPSRPKSSGGKP